MAAKGTIGGKIVLDGEKEYREALKNIKADQQELRSEMKLCNSEFKNNQNSLDALTKKHEILLKQIEAQTKKVNVYQEAMNSSAKKQELASEKIAALKQELEKAEKEMAAFSESSGDNAEAMAEQSKTIEDLKGKLEKAEESYNKAGQRAKYYQTALNDASAELNNMQDDLNKTTRYMEEAEKSTDNCATSINSLGKETGEASEKISIFGDALKANLAAEVIVDGAKAIVNGIKNIASAATDVSIDFNASMSVVAATMGMTAEQINAGSKEYKLLEEAAKKCGATTKYSATEAAEAENYLALAGYDVKKIVETLPKVLDLAAAGDMDLAYASDLVTDSMAALNLETSQLDMYMDGMTRTAQKSNTSIAQLGEATLVCAGTVTLAGQSLETMNTELGVLANNGIKGAEGGTHLRNVILSLTAPTDSASAALQELGVQISDSSGNMRDLNDIMVDLNAKMEGMSTTEKTQMINRIFNKTDIAAVNALLKGTGEEYDNLNKQIKNCSGAAKDMANTMNNNLKGDVTILKSALEGLGIAAEGVFDKNMRTAVQGATSAVERLQKSVTDGELNTSLNKLSTAVGKFCEGALELGEDALPVAIDGLTWILDNADLIAAGVAGIAAANLQMKVVGPAIEAAQAAWTAYKTATDGATVTQWLLNTAMSANPAGLLITAIAGLTAAVGAYILINRDNLEVLSETAQKSHELAEATASLNTESTTAQDTREKSRAGLEQEATAAKKLVDELATLQAKTKLTNSEQLRQNQIIDELNSAYPDLNLRIDEQTGLLNMSTDAIYTNIDALSALDKANAAREDMSQIAQEQWEMEKQLAELREQRKAQLAELTEAEEKLNDTMAKLNEYSSPADAQAMDDYIWSVKEGQEALAALDAAIESTNGSISSLSEEYEYCYNYVSQNEGIYNTAAATGELGDAAAAAGGKLSELAEEANTAFQEMQDNVRSSVESQLDIFAKFQKGTEISTKDLLSNMQSQIDGISEWAENMELLADRGINQGLLQHLAEMGPEGAGYVATFVKMTDEELAKANELFTESMSLPDETTEKVMESYQTAGQMAAEGFRTGIKDNAQDVANQAEKMASDTLKATNDALDIHSPSRKFAETGRNVDLGIIQGINQNRPQTLAAVSTICSMILATGESGIRTESWQELGKRIPEGMRQGIEDGSAAVVGAVESMARAAVEAARKELDIHSPSKKFDYMGEMSGEGYIGGWVRSMSDIDAVVAQSMPDIDRVIEMSLPEVHMAEGGSQTITNSTEKRIEVIQEINIYSPADDPIETARRLKESQREAAEEW